MPQTLWETSVMKAMDHGTSRQNPFALLLTSVRIVPVVITPNWSLLLCDELFVGYFLEFDHSAGCYLMSAWTTE